MSNGEQETTDSGRPLSDQPQQLALQLEQRPALGREDFLVASSNAAAVAWIDRWPNWLAPAAVIVGPPGSGKSHLAQVWRVQSQAQAPSHEELLSVPARDFMGQANCCLVDDADRLAGQPEAEQALFHLYNLLRERQGQLLLTGQTAPNHWPLQLPDLRSRLATLVPVVLGLPDDALMQALLVKLFSDRQLAPGRGVVEYLVPRMERSYLAAQRLVEAIDQRSLAEKREVKLPLVRDVLDDQS
ncbi:HdaA/DnaA family protein [Rhodovibrionaceae bacterium A322]